MKGASSIYRCYIHRYIRRSFWSDHSYPGMLDNWLLRPLNYGPLLVQYI